MKTLHNHVILYNEECPMCNLYTKAFVQSGMLDRKGRACYQHMPVNLFDRIDQQRAVNEIAMVNKETGWMLTFTWVLYRMIILLAIVFFQ